MSSDINRADILSLISVASPKVFAIRNQTDFLFLFGYMTSLISTFAVRAVGKLFQLVGC